MLSSVVGTTGRRALGSFARRISFCVRFLCVGRSTRVPAADRLSAGDKRSSREGVPRASGLGLPFRQLDAAPSAVGCRAWLTEAVSHCQVYGSITEGVTDDNACLQHRPTQTRLTVDKSRYHK